jgi:hypothetical protein
MLTITSHNYSRPSETLITEAREVPLGEQQLAVEQTIRDVIEAHSLTNVHTAESVMRGIMMHEAINKTNSVREPSNLVYAGF